jgi:hypothetical protein
MCHHWPEEALDRMRSAAAAPGLVMEAVVDTRAVVSILGTEQYAPLGCKPPDQESSFPDASWFG